MTLSPGLSPPRGLPRSADDADCRTALEADAGVPSSLVSAPLRAGVSMPALTSASLAA
eukprot:CAMPEP_0185200868 /NCGR_PEP_ID=MMETSP1140-20130426/48178_1 /TAXON_ID=298111 /ORGANISM="Pavlova sp., Strain CCMP459" /LENGTH=57 /DNA_ID=CAMNT_0027768235 /DNA_START=9 /DNA_END=178 /DNA_ORIENTATION=+